MDLESILRNIKIPCEGLDSTLGGGYGGPVGSTPTFPLPGNGTLGGGYGGPIGHTPTFPLSPPSPW
jgi:hypothetical protein